MAGHQARAPLVCLISGVTTELGRTISYTFAEEGGRPVLVGETGERDELGKVRGGRDLSGLFQHCRKNAVGMSRLI